MDTCIVGWTPTPSNRLDQFDAEVLSIGASRAENACVSVVTVVVSLLERAR